MESAPDHLVRQHPNNAEYCSVRESNGPLAATWGQGQDNAGGQDKKECGSVQSHPPHVGVYFLLR